MHVLQSFGDPAYGDPAARCRPRRGGADFDDYRRLAECDFYGRLPEGNSRNDNLGSTTVHAHLHLELRASSVILRFPR